ncbi:hypothetical protein OG762_46775 (plasmid) [Streptomyces sp. NBC_01136]|uniref:hypothetical protein n=1 Tax=Streptomyces sp. NBC_01136 TaxID=2903754 RepID=UPI00386CD4EB|nr:hypothetical protein OG762_46775 [Streptomyces sp. NBC_01136]
MSGDLVGPDQGDIRDKQSDQAFSFPHRGVGVIPEGGEIAGQGSDPGPLRVVEDAVAVVLGALVCAAGGGEFAQGCVPVGFQAARDEPVVRIEASP